MQIVKIVVDDKELIFVNEREEINEHGFTHTTTVFINGVEYGSAWRNWFQKPWGRHEFQCVMEDVIYDLRYKRRDFLWNKFMTERGYIRTSQKRRDEFLDYVNMDDEFNLYDDRLIQKIRCLNKPFTGY